MMLNSQGRVLVQSDGLSPSDPDSVIDQYLSAGNYSLVVESTGGAGTYVLDHHADAVDRSVPVHSGGKQPIRHRGGDFTGDGHTRPRRRQTNTTTMCRCCWATATAPSSPRSPTRSGGPGRDRGWRLHRRRPPRPGRRQRQLRWPRHGVGVAGQRRRHVPAPGHLRGGVESNGIVAGDFTGDGHLDLAVANESGTTLCRCCWATATAPSSPRSPTRSGGALTRIVAGDFTGDGHLDLAVGKPTGRHRVGAAGQRRRHLPAPGHLRGRDRARTPSWRGTSPATATSTWPSQTTLRRHCVGAAGQRRRHVPAPGHLRGGVGPGIADRGGRLHRRRPHSTWPSSNGWTNTVSVLLGNGDGTFQPAVDYAVRVGAAADRDRGGRLQRRRPTSTSPSPTRRRRHRIGAAGQRRRHIPATSSRTRSGSGPMRSWRGTSPATATSTWPSPTSFRTTVSILLGNGDGTFQPQVTYAVGSDPGRDRGGDFNGDGRLDLAVADSGTAVSVLLGNGDGTFQPQVTRTRSGTGTRIAIVAGDFTGDGRPRPRRRQPTTIGVSGAAGQRRRHVPACQTRTRRELQVRHRGGGLHRRRPHSTWPSSTDNYGTGTVSVLLGNGDGTFQPAVTYAVGVVPLVDRGGRLHRRRPARPGRRQTLRLRHQTGRSRCCWATATARSSPRSPTPVGTGSSPGYAIVAGDFTGDGRIDLAVANPVSTTRCRCCWATATARSSPRSPTRSGIGADRASWRATSPATASSTWPSPTQSDDVSVLLGNGDGTFADPGQFATTPHATPLVADVTGDGTDDVLVVDGAGDILYRQGIPGQPGTLRAARHGQPRTIPSRDIAWVPNTGRGPAARQRRRPGRRRSRSTPSATAASSGSARSPPASSRRRSSRPTSNGNGLDDLVVRNAGDGTLSVFFGTPVHRSRRAAASIPPTFLPPVTLPVGLGVSDVQAVDTTGSGRLDLVVTNKLTGQVSVLRNLGDGTFAPPVPYRAGTGLVRGRYPAARPRSPAWKRRRASPPDRSRPAARPTW